MKNMAKKLPILIVEILTVGLFPQLPILGSFGNKNTGDISYCTVCKKEA